MYTVRKNKYNAKSTFYGGYWYASKLEAGYAQELDLRFKAKDIKKWERQVPIPIYLHKRLITTYKIDFVVWENDGTKTYVETKGIETYAWRLRWKMFEAIINATEPENKVEVVKAQNNYLYGRKKRK